MFFTPSNMQLLTNPQGVLPHLLSHDDMQKNARLYLQPWSYFRKSAIKFFKSFLAFSKSSFTMILSN